MQMHFETVSYAVADHVATVAMNRPEARNALSDQLLDDLIAALTAAREDDEVRCVVLTSTHEKVFSAGGDLGGFASEQPLSEKYFATDRFPRLFHLLGELGKPTPPTATCWRARSASRWPAT
jgi:enoyl-CoA hydratase